MNLEAEFNLDILIGKMEKKLKHLLLAMLMGSSLFAQNPSYQQKLYYTCKVWGFVKYYHSEVSTCQVNWDSVLVADLPLVKNAITQSDFNDALDTILNAAGPMQIATTSAPAPLPPELRRNADFSWFNDTMLRNDVRVILDTIKNNFRPHPICWVKDNDYSTSYNGWLIFPFDDTCINVNIATNFPDEPHRLLTIFKYWNIINYFNPNNYILDNPIDSVLYTHAINIANAQNANEFFYTFKKITASLNDAHAEGLSWSQNNQFPYYYLPSIVLQYAEQKYIVAKVSVTNIHKGDALVSVNGLSPTVWEDSLRPYVSAGDSSIFRRYMCQYILSGTPSSSVTMVFKDSLGNNYTRVMSRTTPYNNVFFQTYYPNDTLANVQWKKWGCDVGYVNMGKLLSSSVNNMYYDLYTTSSIIFDIRNYPNGTAWQIADLIYPQPMCFAKDMEPDVTYPGTYSWYNDSLGVTGSIIPSYQGKIIILVNEKTQSQAEYSCMILKAMPNVIIVGSHTAGADGNITYFNLSNEIHTGFTTLGVFYPNGDGTQRIGIVPDSLVYMTQVGIRHGRDEVLEKALEIAQCWTAVPENSKEVLPALSVFPNPAFDFVNIQAINLEGKIASIIIRDVAGRTIVNATAEITDGNLFSKIDLKSFSSGIYFLELKSGDKIFASKIVKP